MGYAKKRVGKGGRPGYTAVYVDLRGSERSAGTFGSQKAADRARQQAEAELRQGRVGDQARGRQAFRKYVAERWLPNPCAGVHHPGKYIYYLGAYILPELGPMRMADIFPEHVREWITRMQREGRSAWTIQYCKSSILGAPWGELTELRVSDLDMSSRILTVSRKVIELNRKFHPRGQAVPGRALPQGQGVAATQAQRADHRQAQGSHQGAQAGTG